MMNGMHAHAVQTRLHVLCHISSFHGNVFFLYAHVYQSSPNYDTQGFKTFDHFTTHSKGDLNHI